MARVCIVSPLILLNLMVRKIACDHRPVLTCQPSIVPYERHIHGDSCFP